MTRFLALSLAAFALAFGACEKHPLAGQEPVTHTHGSDGPGAHEERAATAHGAGAASEAKDEAKKGAHAPAAPAEAPKFFPEKK